ncbi:Streptogramin A acetyltransferase [compost metagenome]
MKITSNNEYDLENNIERLFSLYFRMSRVDGSYGIEPIKLLKNGTIYGHSSPNEYSWKFIDGHLTFLSKEGKVSTIFDQCYLIDEKLVLTGPFLLKPHLAVTHKLQQIDFSWKNREKSEILTKNILKESIAKYNWEIGDHTYGRLNVLEPRMAKLRVGKFCSIAGAVTVILGNHRTDTVTTYPFSTLSVRWPGVRRYFIEDHVTNGDVIIGNDVWIGRAATIMSGVTIGNGAIIAANSLVNKDVAPYSIVGGTPSKLIKFRHSPQVISDLLRIKWWDWSDETIDSRLPEMLSDVETFIKNYK